jgi:hypothetical protein
MHFNPPGKDERKKKEEKLQNAQNEFTERRCQQL